MKRMISKNEIPSTAESFEKGFIVGVDDTGSYFKAGRYAIEMLIGSPSTSHVGLKINSFPSYTTDFYTSGGFKFFFGDKERCKLNITPYGGEFGTDYNNIGVDFRRMATKDGAILCATDPTEDGTYVLKLVKSGSSFTYQWVKEE